MAVVIETTLGDLTVDLFTEQRPKACLNFLKLCKMKYYNFNLFHMIQHGFIAQTGDPTGEGTGGQSVWGVLEGPDKRYFEGEKQPKIRHTDHGLLSMVASEEGMIGSQFFFTLSSDLNSLDAQHCVIGEVTEGHDVLRLMNETICDAGHRPYQDVRITHTVVLEDPYNDPKDFRAPSRSPSPSAARLAGGRIAPDEEIDETVGKSETEIAEMIEEKEAKARATILEIVGDLPDAEMAPPENVLFVCKLNPVTTDDDLEIIFSRFGKIVCCEVIRDKKSGESLQYAFIEFENKKSCEDAYFKMDNVLIDDRRIHVDFSQSVSKIKWQGKGRGVIHVDDDNQLPDKKSYNRQQNDGKNHHSDRRLEKDSRVKEPSSRDRENERSSNNHSADKYNSRNSDHRNDSSSRNRSDNGQYGSRSNNSDRSRERFSDLRYKQRGRTPERRTDSRHTEVSSRNTSKYHNRDRSIERRPDRTLDSRNERYNSKRERTPESRRKDKIDESRADNDRESNKHQHKGYSDSHNKLSNLSERGRTDDKQYSVSSSSRSSKYTNENHNDSKSTERKKLSHSDDIKTSKDNSNHPTSSKHERDMKKRKHSSKEKYSEENNKSEESPVKKKKDNKQIPKTKKHKKDLGSSDSASTSEDNTKKKKKNVTKTKTIKKKKKQLPTSDSSSSSESSSDTSSSSSDSDRKKKVSWNKSTKNVSKTKKGRKKVSSSSSSNSSSSSSEGSSSSSDSSDSGHERSRKKLKNKKSVREKSVKKMKK